MKVLETAALTCALLGSAARAAAYTEALISLHKTLVEGDSTTKSEALETQALKTYLETNFPSSSRPRKACVLLTSHIDTVPPYIPYSRNGDEIWGRDTSDAKDTQARLISVATPSLHLKA
ncbi:hypothetical protein EsH8_II_000196 [Colletotrichum jinshuiense]